MIFSNDDDDDDSFILYFFAHFEIARKKKKTVNKNEMNEGKERQCTEREGTLKIILKNNKK